MYCLSDLCCVCLQLDTQLQCLNILDEEGISYYEKLLLCLPEMDCNDINERRLVCVNCQRVIDQIFEFRKKCLENKAIFMNYLSQLRSGNNVNAKLNVFLVDIKVNELDTYVIDSTNQSIKNVHDINNTEDTIEIIDDDCEIVVKEEIDIKTENFYDEYYEEGYVEDSSFNFNIKTEKDEHIFLEPEQILNPFEYVKSGHFLSDLANGNDVIDRDAPKIVTSDKNADFQNDSFFDTQEVSQAADTTELNEMLGQAQPKYYRCEICNKEFLWPSYLARHMQIHSTEKSNECKICNKKFRWSGDLIRHLRKHSNEKLDCEMCHKKFNISEGIEIQMPYTCNGCKKQFTHSEDLSTHNGNHYGEISFMCIMCKKKFSNSMHLMLHMKSHKNIHKCTVCNCEVSGMQNFLEHKETHITDETYQCAVCGKHFVYFGQFSKHLRTHEGQDSYECKICSLQFRSVVELSSHKSVHDKFVYGKKKLTRKEIKTRECQVCHKKFSDASNFNRHMRIHTGEKPYKCTDCGRRFTQSNHLVKHKMIHAPISSNKHYLFINNRR